MELSDLSISFIFFCFFYWIKTNFPILLSSFFTHKTVFRSVLYWLISLIEYEKLWCQSFSIFSTHFLAIFFLFLNLVPLTTNLTLLYSFFITVMFSLFHYFNYLLIWKFLSIFQYPLCIQMEKYFNSFSHNFSFFSFLITWRQ